MVARCSWSWGPPCTHCFLGHTQRGHGGGTGHREARPAGLPARAQPRSAHRGGGWVGGPGLQGRAARERAPSSSIGRSRLKSTVAKKCPPQKACLAQRSCLQWKPRVSKGLPLALSAEAQALRAGGGGSRSDCRRWASSCRRRSWGPPTPSPGCCPRSGGKRWGARGRHRPRPPGRTACRPAHPHIWRSCPALVQLITFPPPWHTTTQLTTPLGPRLAAADCLGGAHGPGGAGLGPRQPLLAPRHPRRLRADFHPIEAVVAEGAAAQRELPVLRPSSTVPHAFFGKAGVCRASGAAAAPAASPLAEPWLPAGRRETFPFAAGRAELPSCCPCPARPDLPRRSNHALPAHEHFEGSGGYKWMLYGDDDTLWFMDSVVETVAGSVSGCACRPAMLCHAGGCRPLHSLGGALRLGRPSGRVPPECPP